MLFIKVIFFAGGWIWNNNHSYHFIFIDLVLVLYFLYIETILLIILTFWKYFSNCWWTLDWSKIFQTFEIFLKKVWFQMGFTESHVFKNYCCHLLQLCGLCMSSVNLCVWDKIVELFRYLSYLIKMKICAAFRKGCFFTTEGHFWNFFMDKKIIQFYASMALFRTYGSQRYVTSVGPY